MKVLVIEDNQILSRNLVRYLSMKDIFTDLALDWEEWLKKVLTKYYDLIILDINLPWINWIEICKKIREKWKDVYIIMLTSMWTDENIINWLESWADDYLVKPFEYSVLLARIKAILRRNKIDKNNILKTKDIELDLNTLEVRKNWDIVKLSKLEYDLLKYLLENRTKALSRREIYEKVWWEFDCDFMFSKTIDVYIWYLRKKLWKDLIETKQAYWFLIN